MLGKGFFRLLGVPEDAHQGVTGVHLLDVAVELPSGRPLLDEVGLRALADLGGDDGRGGHGHQGDRGQEGGNEEHHDEDADDRQQRRHDLAQGLLEGLGNIVDVVGGTAQYLAQRLAVEIAQRQAGQLGLHLLAQPEDRTLHGHGEQPPLHQATQRGGEVDHEHQQQDLADMAEVDPPAGRQVHRSEHGGERAVPLVAQPGHHFSFGHPSWEFFGDDTGEDQVGGVAQQPGPQHRKADAGRAEPHGEADQRALGAELTEQAPGRRAEIEGLFDRPPAAHEAAPAETAAARPPADGHGAHAASSSVSWERTISR